MSVTLNQLLETNPKWGPYLENLRKETSFLGKKAYVSYDKATDTFSFEELDLWQRIRRVGLGHFKNTHFEHVNKAIGEAISKNKEIASTDGDSNTLFVLYNSDRNMQKLWNSAHPQKINQALTHLENLEKIYKEKEKPDPIIIEKFTVMKAAISGSYIPLSEMDKFAKISFEELSDTAKEYVKGNFFSFDILIDSFPEKKTMVALCTAIKKLFAIYVKTKEFFIIEIYYKLSKILVLFELYETTMQIDNKQVIAISEEITNLDEKNPEFKNQLKNISVKFDDILIEFVTNFYNRVPKPK